MKVNIAECGPSIKQTSSCLLTRKISLKFLRTKWLYSFVLITLKVCSSHHSNCSNAVELPFPNKASAFSLGRHILTGSICLWGSTKVYTAIGDTSPCDTCREPVISHLTRQSHGAEFSMQVVAFNNRRSPACRSLNT